MKISFGSGCLLTVVIAASGMGVQAATLETWTFSQSGFVSQGHQATISGSFSGLLEPSGLIELSDLIQFSLAPTSAKLANVQFFSFDTTPGAGGGTLSLVVLTDFFGEYCAGAPAAIGYMNYCTPSGGVSPPGVNGVFPLLREYSMAVPTVQFVSAVDVSPAVSVAGPADAPEASTTVLAGIGLLGARLAWRTRGRDERGKPGGEAGIACPVCSKNLQPAAR